MIYVFMWILMNSELLTYKSSHFPQTWSFLTLLLWVELERRGGETSVTVPTSALCTLDFIGATSEKKCSWTLFCVLVSCAWNWFYVRGLIIKCHTYYVNKWFGWNGFGTWSGGKLCSSWRMLLLYWHCQWLRAQATQSAQLWGQSVMRLLWTASSTSTGWAPGSFRVRSMNFGSLQRQWS